MCNRCSSILKHRKSYRHHVKFTCQALKDDVQKLELSSPQTSPDIRSPSPSSPHQQTDIETLTTPAQSTCDEDSTSEESLKFKKTESAFKSRIVTFELRKKNLNRKVTLNLFLTFIFEHLVSLLKKVLESHNSVKVNIFLECEFQNLKGETCQKNFKTVNIPLTQSTDLDDYCSELFQKIVSEKEECDMKGSGWCFVRVTNFEVRVNEYNPLKAGHSFIPSPRKFHGVVNVKNIDNECFKYSLLAKFVSKGDATLPSSYTPELFGKYNWECVSFPVKLSDINIFEKTNNISINVFGLDKENKVYPLKVCNSPLADHRDLLLLSNKSKDTHYVYIADFNTLVASQLNKRKHKLYVCKKCFAYFGNNPNKLGLTGEERLIEHERFCHSKGPLRLDLCPDPTISFKNTERSQRVRFTIYADFESVLVPKDQAPPHILNPNLTKSENSGEDTRNPTKSHIPESESITHVHIANSYCYLIKDSQNNSSEPVIRQYRGADAAKHFVKSLTSDVYEIGNTLYGQRQMTPTLTPDEQSSFNTASLCHICGKTFSDLDKKVRDHQHSHPFKYRGASHSSCNLRYQEQSTINCYFHNLNYDSHFILKELGYSKSNISVIPSSEEKYVSFTKYIPFKQSKKGFLKVRFVDTLRFLPSSLDALAKNLPKECFHETRKRFPEDTQFNLLTRKGVFPYEYISSFEKLDETRLPDKNSFYNKMTLKQVSDPDYQHAQNVWQTFKIRTLGEYSDLYLLTDVLLLTDIYENFRDTSLKTHELDPAYYITLPSYSWDCMLKKTGVTLDTIQDHDMYLFFEKGIRGGITQCCKRMSKANNQHCAHFNKSLPSKYISYVDANNLYGWAMSQFLPTGGFCWLDQIEIDNFNLESLPDDGSEGYVLEVDVEYPNTLHDQHRDLPFLCERKVPPGSKHPKLLTTLFDKSHYIVHYRVLKQALQYGLKVTKVHRVLKFDQSPWLKPYIDLNTNLRKQAKNEFEKDLYKLYNNSVFGKCMENVRNRMNFKLVCDAKKVEKLIAKTNFKYTTIFSKSLVGVHLEKTNIVLEKPIYAGMCVLELSKFLMYDFLYGVVHPHYGVENVNLLYMDTDSYVFELATPNLYQSLLPIQSYFDTSGLSKDNPAFSPTNAKVLGKMKDEMGGKYISEFLGVRAKVYCIVPEDSDHENPCIKKCKGITKHVTDKVLTAKLYRDCITENSDWYTMNSTFRSYKHILVTKWENKLTLSGYDGKRHLLPDRVCTVPHGHYLVNSE